MYMLDCTSNPVIIISFTFLYSETLFPTLSDHWSLPPSDHFPVVINLSDKTYVYVGPYLQFVNIWGESLTSLRIVPPFQISSGGFLVPASFLRITCLSKASYFVFFLSFLVVYTIPYHARYVNTILNFIYFSFYIYYIVECFLICLN